MDDETDASGMTELLRAQKERLFALKRFGCTLAAQGQQTDGGQRNQTTDEGGDQLVLTIAFVSDETGGEDRYATEGNGEKDRHREDARRHENQGDVEQRRCDVQFQIRVGNEDHAADGDGRQPGEGV